MRTSTQVNARRVASQIVPVVTGSGKEWTEHARLFVEGIVLALREREQEGETIQPGTLRQYITQKPASELRLEVPEDHDSQSFFEDDNARTFASVRATACAVADLEQADLIF